MTRRVDPLVALPFAVERMFHAESGTPHERRMARQQVRRLTAKATQVALDVDRVARLEERAAAGERLTTTHGPRRQA